MGAQKDSLSIKCYVSDDNRITLNCPNCGAVTATDVSNFKGIKNQIKVRCKCKEIFTCFLEFRKHYRKKVKIGGEYVNLRNKQSDLMTVNDISLGGIGFSSMTRHAIRVGDDLRLKFRLDDKKRTEIQLEARVKSVRDYNVGAQFHEPHQYKKDLSFYFMN